MRRSLAASLVVSNLALAATSVLLPERALAQGRTTFGVAFEAPEGCPTKREFVDEVLRRSKKAAPVGPAELPDVAVSVKIDPKKRPFVGRLALTTGTSFKERTVTDRRCADVVSAIALVTALAIDPEAETRPLASLPEPAPPEPPAPSPPLPAPPSTPMGPVASRVWATPLPAEPLGLAWVAPPLPAWVVRPPPARSLWGLELGAAAAMSVGLYEQPLVGVQLFAGLRRPQSPSFGLDLGFRYVLQPAPTTVTQLDAAMALAAGELRFCGPGWAPVKPLRFFPCATFEAGAALVTLTNPRDATASGAGPWVALGVGGRAQWLWTPGLGLQAELDLTLPATQPEFRNGGQTVVEGGPAAFDAALGLFLNVP
jgi:hypothetical protein